MKKILLATAVAAASLGVAGTASAAMPVHQFAISYYNYHGQNINQMQRDIERRIDVGVRRGDLTRREASALRSEFRYIQRLEVHYRRGGLSVWERRDLDRRLDVLSRKVRFERHDRDWRGDGRPDRRGW